MLLEAIALRDGEPFHKITTVEITFDGPIPDERFQLPAASSWSAPNDRRGQRKCLLTTARGSLACARF